MEIYERAARAKLRFNSSRGELTTEDLFDLPLEATGNRLSLDQVAREVYKELKGYDEVSFVETKPEPRRVQLELQMEIVKHVIESKKQDRLAVENRVKKMELRRQLTEALALKQGEELKGLTVEQIQAKLAELGD